MAYLLLLIGVLILTAVCIDVFTGCMPPKTAWDRTQRRSEEEWILSAKVEFLNSEKGQRDRYKLLGTRNLHLSKRTPENGATTDRTWYLIWEAADRCLLKVVSTVHHVSTHVSLIIVYLELICIFLYFPIILYFPLYSLVFPSLYSPLFSCIPLYSRAFHCKPFYTLVIPWEPL